MFDFLPWLRPLGMTLIILAALMLVFTYYPILKQEVRYRFTQHASETQVLSQAMQATVLSDEETKTISPIDENFGIVIPKIGANSIVVPQVDWQDSQVYQQALTRGVAHARGTSLPGEEGNIFIFAHSGANFYEALRFNAVFYLMDKLEAGDAIILFYQGQQFTYRVSEKKLVSAEAMEYLSSSSPKKTLTLMTCWPPGTTLERLIILAEAE